MSTDRKIWHQGGKVEVLEVLGEIVWSGRKYQIVRERVMSGQEYVSLKLYNDRGKFIKRFMIDSPVAGAVGAVLMAKSPYTPGTFAQAPLNNH